MALLGPNGAGKTTLLSLAATLLRPSSGELLYGHAARPQDPSAIRARIGFLAHDLFIYPELTAAENLLFFAQLHGVGHPRQVVDDALHRARLGDRRDDPVHTFSRGMRQRLAIERALLHQPRLILLDEPFTGLDDDSVTATRERLAELRAGGAILLVTTHDLDAIAPVANRAVILSAGRLIPVPDSEGSLRDRYRRVVRPS